MSIDSPAAPAVPDACPPDACLPDACLPDACLPDACLPDPGLPDPGLPDPGLPDPGPASRRSVPVRYLRPCTAPDVREFAVLVEAGLYRRVVADVHVGFDVPDDRRTRAGAVAEVLPLRLLDGGAAVCGADAAWLYAGGDPPDRLHVAMPVRRGKSGTLLVVVHEARIPEGDVEVVDGVPVTVPARTAADVARTLPEDQALPLLQRLATAVPVDPRDALVHLERLSGCRGVETARRTVLRWVAGRPGPGELSPAAARTR